MPHGSTAMRPSSSCLRSLLHFSRRLHFHHLRLPNPRLPPPLSTHFRLLSSLPGGAGWASYDPLSDRLVSSASASASAVAASSSDSETSADSDVWGVYDPVAGRVILQPHAPAPSPSSSSDDAKGKRKEKKNDKEEGKEEEEEDEEKEKGKSSGVVGRSRWSALAAGRRGGGRAAKERVSYVCQNCGESSSQWWGTCRQCKAVGTVTRFVAEPAAAAAEASWMRGTEMSEHALRSWLPQKSREMVPQSLPEVNKGVDQAEWRIPL